MKWFVFFFWLPFTLFAEPIKLLDLLKTAEKGDYFIMQTGKSATLLHLKNLNEDVIVLEEISFPMKKCPKDAQTYLQKKAPFHSSWTETNFDLKSLKVTTSFSFVQKSFIDTTNFQDFFSILVKLPFEFVEDKDRKKIGLDFEQGIDTRKNWEPPLPKHVERNLSKWEVYRSRWPKDGSDLSDKVIEVYLYQGIPFPIWIEVKAAAYKGKLRMVDLGKHLSSPLRAPEPLMSQ